MLVYNGWGGYWGGKFGGGDGKGGGGTLTKIALHDRLERYSKVQV